MYVAPTDLHYKINCVCKTLYVCKSNLNCLRIRLHHDMFLSKPLIVILKDIFLVHQGFASSEIDGSALQSYARLAQVVCFVMLL